MYRISKQILAIGLPVTAVAATGAAVAYWTGGGGTGSGDATTATPAATVLTVTQASAPTTMAPGIPSGPITVTVSNPGTTNVYATQVVVSIASVTKASGAPEGTCTAADYTLSPDPMTTGAGDIAPSASRTFSGASLVFNNTADNQDACKGAVVRLRYDVS